MAPPDASNKDLPQSIHSKLPAASTNDNMPLNRTPPTVELNALPAMVYTYTINHADGSSDFPYVSEYCQTMFGFSADLLMAHPELLMNAVHKEDSERFTKSVVESMQNMTVWDFQFRMLHKDGNVIFVHGKSKPELIPESVGEEIITLTKWSGVLFDMTIQEKNNQARRAEMRLLMNESMAPIFGIDCSGIIDKWNAVMCRLTGYSAEEAIGKSLVSFMSEQERGSMTMLLSSILRSSEQHMEQECVLLTKQDQTRLYLFVKCSKRHDSNGDIAGVAFVGQDVTRLKQEEEEKKAALKLADAEKGLTEWLSHEVRNPLSIATEAAEALKEDATLELESASHVDLISQSLRYIVALLSDMLDLNKCIEGKVIVHPKECNIRKEVLIPTQNMMNLRNKSVQVIVDGGEDITAVVDSLRLQQVLTNLISNSLKFTAVGFVKVSLVRTSEETIFLSVRDSGCGISEQHYESLFSKWEQLGSRTNGTGIGLCLCQALVRVMGGHISLNRDYSSGIEGHPGAEFIIELPAKLKSDDIKRAPSPINTFDAVSRAVVAARKSSNADTPVDGTTTALNNESNCGNRNLCVTGKYHILIVDDDKVGRKFIRRRFQRLFPDAIIEEAVSGEEAVAKAKERDIAYDIITMDHFMAIGDMNGAETIKALRKEKVDAVIIGISGNAKGEEHLSAGAENFLQKPIPSDTVILDMILAHLAPPNGWQVLIVDDVHMNHKYLGRKLRKISSPHFTDMAVAERRWIITTAETGEEAIELLNTQSFDLIVLDHHLGDGINGEEVGRFAR